MRFIQCDIDDQKEDASNKLDKVVKEGAITSVNENDYICRDYSGYERWTKCVEKSPLVGGGSYIEEGNSLNAKGTAYYCCSNRFYTQPCSQVYSNKERLCLHTEFEDETSEDKQLELAETIGANYVKQILSPLFLGRSPIRQIRPTWQRVRWGQAGVY